MSRFPLVFVALFAGLAGGVGTQFLLPAPAETPSGPDEATVRRIVSEMLDSRPVAEPQSIEVAEIDPSTINPMIEQYLMDDPKVLQRVSDALQEVLRTEEMEQARLALAEFEDEIYADPDHVVIGNPEGDVTLVEFFDYNCTYCRSSLPDVARLIEEDPNLRVILKEFPVLSADSMDAARVAVAVSREDSVDYWQFHSSLFTSRGQVNADTALAAAEELGLNPIDLELQAADLEITQVLERSYELAQGLAISGTPTFIIGNEIIPGAIGYDGLKERIDNMRACGSTVCDG